MNGCINIVKIYKNDDSYKHYLKWEHDENISRIAVCTEKEDFLDWSYIDYFTYDPKIVGQIRFAFTSILYVIFARKLIIENIKAFEKILRRVYEQYGHDYYWNSRDNVNNASYSNKY